MKTQIARIVLSLVIIALDLLCIRATVRVPSLAKVLRDVVPVGAPFPPLTQLVVDGSKVLLFMTILLTGIGLGLLAFSSHTKRSLIVAAVVTVLLFLQWQIVILAMQMPINALLGEPPR